MVAQQLEVDYDAKLDAFPELRGCAEWGALGLGLTTASDRCAKLLDLSFRAAFTRSAPRYHGLDGAKVAAAAVEADEACPMAHIAALALRLIGGSKAGPHVQPGLAAARAACDARGSAWERRHLEIVQAYASPDDDSVGDLYTALVADYPFDILALSLAFIHNSPARRAALLHNTDAMLGGGWGEADCPAGICDGQPGDLLPFLFAEHSYSLGENERYEESEEFARRALELEPTCALATHQMAHLFEMTGRSGAGTEFLAETEDNWNLGGQATHIYWHWGLLHLESGDHTEALRLYELTLQTAKRDDASGARSSEAPSSAPIPPLLTSGRVLLAVPKCVNDLASLLFRLHLDGMPPETTERLAKEVLAVPQVEALVGGSTGSAALDVHLTMLLSLAGRQAEAPHLTDADADPTAVSVRFGQASALTTALCSAVTRYTVGEYDAAADLLEALTTHATDFWEETEGVVGVVPDAWRPMGLSNAQRDICTQLYLRSLLNSADAARHGAAAEMIAARERAGKDAALTGRLAAALPEGAHAKL